MGLGTQDPTKALCGASCRCPWYKKYLLLGFNLLFWLTRSAVIAFGLWFWFGGTMKDFLSEVESSQYIDLGLYVLVGEGALIIAVGFFRC